MKSYDFDACVFGGEVYCNECLPDSVSTEMERVLRDEDVYPIFADSEWDYFPVCCVCETVHDYVNLIRHDLEYEEDQESL